MGTVPKLDLRNVVKRFGDFTAVDGVSLEVQEGETVVLLGPSGCGKTTILRMVAGFLRPDAGEIRISGRSVGTPKMNLPPEQRGLSMVFQNYAVWPHMTVFENIAFGLRMHKRPGTEIHNRVERMLQIVRMDGLAGRYPAQLSGGQQQRVALARALILEPTLLLFDEPLSNLDATLREEMRFEIREVIRRLKISALYVTHDQAEAMVLGDRVVVMRAGQLEQVGTPEQIYSHAASRFVASFIGVANVLPGEVHRTGPGNVADILVNGVTLRASLRDGVGDPSPPLRAWLLIRPEDVEVFLPTQDPPGNTLPGTVTMRTFLGHTVELRIDTGAGRIRALVAPSSPCRENDSVNVYVHPQRAFILNK